MDFRIKCIAQHFLSAMPKGRAANSFLQRHITKSLNISIAKSDSCKRTAERHFANYRSIHNKVPQTAIEIGAGQHLGVAIHMGLLGCHIVASDIERLANPRLVFEMLAIAGVESLSAAGVTYEAPYIYGSVRGSSTDLVVSNDVLEHVPASQLDALLEECFRILQPRGVCSFWINYRDHWARIDKKIGEHNFLSYGPLAWALLNPPLQYQNRLRHSDYARFFERAGFRIVRAEIQNGEAPKYVHKTFSHYSAADLSALGAWYVLQK